MYPKVNHGEEQSYTGISYNTSVEVKKKKKNSIFTICPFNQPDLPKFR